MQLDKSDGRYAMNYMRNMLFIIVTLSVLIYKYYIYYLFFFITYGRFPKISFPPKGGILFGDSAF